MNCPAFMSQLERQLRRKRIAKLVSSGQRCQAVADRFNVAIRTVHKACMEHGVNLSARRKIKNMGIYA